MSGKTHKGLKKRLKRTGTGRLFHRRCGKQNLMSGKPGKRGMRLRGSKELADGDRKCLERQYGGRLAS